MGTYCDTADSPPQRRWHPVVQTTWSLGAMQVGRVRAALFGAEDEAECAASAVDGVDTVRLMLAAVGIPYRVARAEDEEDAQDARCARAIFWEWEDDDWIGLNVRRACGVPLRRDSAWKRSTYYLRSWADDESDGDAAPEATGEKWPDTEDTLEDGEYHEEHEKDAVYVSDDEEEENEEDSEESQESRDSGYSSKDTFGV